MELQQTSLYKQYIEQLGWTVLTLDGVNIFMKRIPFLGVLVKIQRPDPLPYLPKLIPFLKKYHAKRIIVEPTVDTDPALFQTYVKSLSKFFIIHNESFLPTKTILVDVTPEENKIFQKFTEAKRRAVRRATKLNITVKESDSIADLISIKTKSAGMFGGITTYGIDRLWKLLYPKQATILLGYHQSQMVGGILLLFHEHTAFYWIAGATKEGKKCFAPTLLVWEALKLAKKRKCRQFDFVGVYDQRSQKQFTSWKGFTKFKEGFGGYEVYYPINSSH